MQGKRLTLTWLDIFFRLVQIYFLPLLMAMDDVHCFLWSIVINVISYMGKGKVILKKIDIYFGGDEMGFDDDDADTAAMVVVMIMQNELLFWCLGRRAIFQKIDFYTSHNIKTKLLLCCKGNQTFKDRKIQRYFFLINLMIKNLFKKIISANGQAVYMYICTCSFMIIFYWRGYLRIISMRRYCCCW